MSGFPELALLAGAKYLTDRLYLETQTRVVPELDIRANDRGSGSRRDRKTSDWPAEINQTMRLWVDFGMSETKMACWLSATSWSTVWRRRGALAGRRLCATFRTTAPCSTDATSLIRVGSSTCLISVASESKRFSDAAHSGSTR